MKFRVQMKDPDVLDDAISDAVERTDLALMDGDEKDAVKEIRVKKTRELASKWFEYGEYLTVEIDTEAQTCVVVPVIS